MNGQYLCGKPIDVSYAYKKDNAQDKHGSLSERVLAFNRPNPGSILAQQTLGKPGVPTPGSLNQGAAQS
jgi:splicing factor 3B subunit 4